MTDRPRRTGTLRWLAMMLPMLLVSLLVSGIAEADPIPVRFYVSPADDGIGGGTLHLLATGVQDEDPTAFPLIPLTVAVWADPSAAAGGQGVFSIQDVSLARTGEIDFGIIQLPSMEDFECLAPQCLVGSRPDATRDRVFAAGDDTSPGATLNSPFRVGYLEVIGCCQGTVRLAAGTALDANGEGALLEIDGLPNEGTLMRFYELPEPTAHLQVLIGVVALGALARRRNGVARQGQSAAADPAACVHGHVAERMPAPEQ